MSCWESYWWEVNIWSGNGLVQLVNKPLPDPIFFITWSKVDHDLHICILVTIPSNWAAYNYVTQWPVTYLMTLSDWTMSCQPGPPRDRYGKWPRWQQRPVGYTFPYKMANFHDVYLKLGRIDCAKFFIWHSEKYLSYCHKLSKWYDESVLCYRRVILCNFAMSKQGPSHYFHLHARAPPTAPLTAKDH